MHLKTKIRQVEHLFRRFLFQNLTLVFKQLPLADFVKSQSLCNTVIFSYLLSAEGQYLYTSYQEVTTGVLCKKQTLPFMVY